MPNELRVFISSTFRDLHEEREHLVKKIFPEIRALCRARGIAFTEVDLRWGLTDEEVVLGQVIRTCLEEIDRCRPYFIGITGERYGYVPDYIEIQKDPELLRAHSWIEDAVLDGASLIEMEFLHGALNDPDAARDSARFFFRRARRSLEAERIGEEQERLEVLKERVRAAGFHASEFRDPVSLGELVYDELIDIIKRDFADAAPPSPLEDERARHRAFAESRRHAYIANPLYVKRLNDWLANAEEPLVIYAESGSGKSSLVSFWCEQLRRRQSDLAVVEHYVGIGAGATDHYTIMRHIIEEITERYGLNEPMPTTPEEIERRFGDWLAVAAERGTLIVIDGINQLSGSALELHWLPERLPSGLRLIVTSTVEQTLVALRARNWKTLGMQPLSEKEREAVTVRFLAEYRKALPPAQVHRIASDIKCAHPLFLRTLLEELRLEARHETLERELDRYLDATGTEDLFQLILERMEDDYGTRSVRDVMSLIWCSRAGLDEHELQDLTGISRLKLSTMIGGLDYHLVRKEGRLTFFHDYLRRAVQRRYLSREGTVREARLRLVERIALSDLGRTDIDNARRLARELMHQYTLGGEWERLGEVLASTEVLGLLDRGEFRYDYLVTLQQTSGHVDVDALYLRAVQQLSDRDMEEARRVGILYDVSEVLSSAGIWGAANTVALVAQERVGALDDAALSARINSSIGYLQMRLGDYRAAVESCTSAVETARRINDPETVATAVRHLGIAQFELGLYADARRCFQEDLTIHEQLGSVAKLGSAAMNYGNALWKTEGVHAAIPMYERALAAARISADRRTRGRVLTNLGSAYSALGRLDEARAMCAESLESCRSTGDRQGEFFTLGILSRIEAAAGDFELAAGYGQQVLELAASMKWEQGRADALERLGSLASQMGQHELAIERHRAAAEICAAIGMVTPRIDNLGQIGVNLRKLGRWEEAFAMAAEMRAAAGAEPVPVSAARFQAATTHYEFGRASTSPTERRHHLGHALAEFRDIESEDTGFLPGTIRERLKILIPATEEALQQLDDRVHTTEQLG